MKQGLSENAISWFFKTSKTKSSTLFSLVHLYLRPYSLPSILSLSASPTLVSLNTRALCHLAYCFREKIIEVVDVFIGLRDGFLSLLMRTRTRNFSFFSFLVIDEFSRKERENLKKIKKTAQNNTKRLLNPLESQLPYPKAAFVSKQSFKKGGIQARSRVIGKKRFEDSVGLFIFRGGKEVC